MIASTRARVLAIMPTYYTYTCPVLCVGGIHSSLLYMFRTASTQLHSLLRVCPFAVDGAQLTAHSFICAMRVDGADAPGSVILSAASTGTCILPPKEAPRLACRTKHDR